MGETRSSVMTRESGASGVPEGPTAVRVPNRGLPGRAAIALGAGAIIAVVGLAVLGQADTASPSPTGATERAAAASAEPAIEPTAGSDDLPAPTPPPLHPQPGAASAAREAGEPFDFTTQDIDEWFSAEEVSAIEADAYRSLGGTVVPARLVPRSTAPSDGWVSLGPGPGQDGPISDGGLIQLRAGPDPRFGQPGTAGFVPLVLAQGRGSGPSDPGIEVAVVADAADSARVAMYLRADSAPAILAFVHLTPSPFRGEPREWRVQVASTIAVEMMRRMRWIDWAAPTSGTPLPDLEGAVPGDDGREPAPLGAVATEPDSIRLDFLFEFCRLGCFRDGHWIDPEDPTRGSGPWTADLPFYVREGFPTDGQHPLGDDFDLVLYATRIDEPSPTYRYEADYRLLGTSERCGPIYRTQQEAVPCEWFVHDFPDGLPEGRWALWAFWEAPCRAWLDYGFTAACDDPNAISSRFSSGFDSPFTQEPAEFDESEG